MKNEIATLPVQGMNDLALIGTQLEKSGMFGLSREGAGLVVAMTCFQQNITPLDFLRTYHIIDNKPAMRADAMAAKFRENGGRYKMMIRTDIEAKAQFFIEDEKIEQVMFCKMTEVKKQGICYKADGKTLKANWQKFPANMLWARMMSNAVRTLMPEIVAGVYTPEEIQDFDDTSAKEEKIINPEVAERKVAEKTAGKAPEKVTEAMKKSEVTVDVKAEEVKPVDFSLCPMEPEVGIPFANLLLADLEAIVECCMDNPKMEQGHKDFVQKLYNERKKDKPKYE